MHIAKIILSVVLALGRFSYAEDISQKTLIIVGADWCKFCKIAKSDIKTNKNLSEIVKNYEIIDIDFDNDKDFIDGYKINKVPTFILLNNKKEIDRKIGYNGPHNLIKFLK